MSQSTTESSQDLLYEMARLIRNTDGLPLTTWGVKCMNVLAKVRALDPEQYEERVKGTANGTNLRLAGD